MHSRATALRRTAGNPGTDVEFNFISFHNGQINQESSQYDSYTPQIGPVGNTLQLTNDNETEAASWFATSQVSVSNFTASFDYQATVSLGNLAHGLAFILQGLRPPGSVLWAATGASSATVRTATASRGAAPRFHPSAAVELNLYNVGPTPGTNLATNGSTGSYNGTGSVDFWDTGHTVQVVLSYSGSNETLS